MMAVVYPEPDRDSTPQKMHNGGFEKLSINAGVPPIADLQSMALDAMFNRMNSTAPVLDPQYLKDGKDRPKAVLLPIKQWNSLMEYLEEMRDVAAYDKAVARKEPVISLSGVLADHKRKRNA